MYFILLFCQNKFLKKFLVLDKIIVFTSQLMGTIMKRFKLMLCCFLGLSSVASAYAQPVMIGGEEEIDACASIAVVERPAPLKTGPAQQEKNLKVLPKGVTVFVCDEKKEWSGVLVIPNRNKPEQCGVSISSAQRKPYQGRCASGWIKTDKLKMIAG